MRVSEKQLEDWICEHPETVFSGFEIVGRQIALPHGILDILGTNGMAIYLIELKAGPIKESHVGQVLRYVHDVNSFIGDLWAGLLYYATDNQDPPDVNADLLDFFWKVEQGPRTLRMQLFHEHILPNADDWQMPCCRPMLIGTSIDANTKAALIGAGGWLGLWRYDEEKHGITIDTGICSHYSDRRMTFPGWTENVVRNYVLGILEYLDLCGLDSELELLFKRTVRTIIEDGDIHE